MRLPSGHQRSTAGRASNMGAEHGERGGPALRRINNPRTFPTPIARSMLEARRSDMVADLLGPTSKVPPLQDHLSFPAPSGETEVSYRMNFAYNAHNQRRRGDRRSCSRRLARATAASPAGRLAQGAVLSLFEGERFPEASRPRGKTALTQSVPCLCKAAACA